MGFRQRAIEPSARRERAGWPNGPARAAAWRGRIAIATARRRTCESTATARRVRSRPRARCAAPGPSASGAAGGSNVNARPRSSEPAHRRGTPAFSARADLDRAATARSSRGEAARFRWQLGRWIRYTSARAGRHDAEVILGQATAGRSLRMVGVPGRAQRASSRRARTTRPASSRARRAARLSSDDRGRRAKRRRRAQALPAAARARRPDTATVPLRRPCLSPLRSVAAPPARPLGPRGSERARTAVCNDRGVPPGRAS